MTLLIEDGLSAQPPVAASELRRAWEKDSCIGQRNIVGRPRAEACRMYEHGHGGKQAKPVEPRQRAGHERAIIA